ncbi:hypothetical protein [Aurantimonas sp. VKM B-3413]|uniref:hypothetical protein n=1 Tax=Aurantimonas sp. VKM B-3413 TaxID=2779401 RepID=UPI001E3530EF|nr:hypothetical protein [Aurantimonas sp. VKM B-3413]MCB8838106.1 hypothetical protein [Aurantimonas sp. VKM B-3413]
MIGQLVAKLLTGEAGVYIARMQRLAVLYAALTVFLLMMLGFLLGALFIFVAGYIGNLYTALAFAAGFFVLILIAWILTIIARRPPRKRADDRLQRDIASIASVAALSNIPLIFQTVKKRKGLLLVPVAAATGWGVWRAISSYRERSRWED